MGSIILGILVVFGIYLISRWLKKNTYHDPLGQHIIIKHHENDEYLDEIDEHSQLNINIDKTLKNINLKNKLKEIEGEKE